MCRTEVVGLIGGCDVVSFVDSYEYMWLRLLCRATLFAGLCRCGLAAGHGRDRALERRRRVADHGGVRAEGEAEVAGQAEASPRDGQHALLEQRVDEDPLVRGRRFREEVERAAWQGVRDARVVEHLRHERAALGVDADVHLAVEAALEDLLRDGGGVDEAEDAVREREASDELGGALELRADGDVADALAGEGERAKIEGISDPSKLRKR